jgi:asparagine synthase (glutamine-hydrolysing)
MCGIVAIVSTGARVGLERARAAVDRMRHRGPDERGEWLAPSGRAALGHARLSIIDLEGGTQPIVNEDGSMAISANGEFYDHDRLRAELSARGHTLASSSDSEVALHLYEELGAGALALLRGEFAFALWDDRAGELVAVRDRFGIKPLFWARSKGRVIVASEIKAILAAGHPARWSREGAFQALNLINHQDATLFEGVHQVPAGHLLRVRGGEVTLERYWDADIPRGDRLAGGDRSEAELIHELGASLEEAIRLRMRADVPVACYLSGGVDSSLVLGMANLGLGHRLAAFTICFDHPDFDEDPIASGQAAEALADYHPIRVTDRDFADVFVDSVVSAEGIQFNGHAPARYILSREVSRAGYKVALGGEGADELFLGYHFARAALERSSSPGGSLALAVARALRRALTPPTPSQRYVAGVSPMLSWACRLIGFPEDLLEGLVARFERVRRLVDDDFLATFEGRDPFREFLGQFDWLGQVWGREPARQIIYLWLKSAFPNYVLAAERMDMAHAVELRLPFLDHHLFAEAMEVPAARVAPAGRNKHLLREIARPYVTESVWRGEKWPFFAPPSSSEAGSAMGDLVADLVAGPDLEAVPFIDAGRARALVDDVARMPAEERALMDPVLYMLASVAALSRRYGLT